MQKRFPKYIQLDTMDCGPTCLRIIAKYYGKSFSLQTLRDYCHISREGVSLLGISDAAEKIGFRTMGVKISFEQLCNEVSLPCIVHWNQCHFVVVYKIEKKKNETYVYISDPASGLLKYKKDQFLKCWAQIVSETSGKKTVGIALLLEPTPKFAEQKDEDSKLNFVSVQF